MKNVIISVLATWLFWNELCEIHPVWVLPIVFSIILAWIHCVEYEVKEYQKSRQRGRSLARKIGKIGKEVSG